MLAGLVVLALASPAAGAAQTREVPVESDADQAARARYKDPAGIVLGVDPAQVTPRIPAEGWPAGIALRENPATGSAWRFDLPDGADFEAGTAGGATQVFVLSGTLDLAGETLGAGDVLNVPQDTVLGRARARPGTSFLLFTDPRGSPSAQSPFRVVRGADTQWRAGTVAPDAGGEPVLEVKPLWTDAESRAQLHLVRIAAGKSVPWELHPSAEEGYLLEGDYHLAECLPSGRRDYAYAPGGYFFRPAGVIHSGPDSTSTTGATWLIRTPTKLSALFYPMCPAGTPAKEKP